MSFEVVCHEHPNIFVVNRQTYETTGSPSVRMELSPMTNRGPTWVRPVGLRSRF